MVPSSSHKKCAESQASIENKAHFTLNSDKKDSFLPKNTSNLLDDGINSKISQ